MLEKLNEKDKRALKIGAIAVLSVLVLWLLMCWGEHWASVRRQLTNAKNELEIICPSETKQKGLRSIVPAFELPKAEQQQKYLFRDKFNEQLSKAKIKTETLKYLPARKTSAVAGYKLLCLQCRKAKANLSQILDLLANLNENPYLAGIEEFRIKCNPKKRQEFELNMTVSTFAK